MASTTQRKRPTTTAGRAKRKGQPAGPPPALLRVLRTDQEGRPVTVHQELVRQLRSAAPIELACAHAGVSKSTFYEWVRDGSRLAVQVHAGQVDPATLEHHQAALYAFATEASLAAAEAESYALLGVQRLASGGYEVRKERTKSQRILVGPGAGTEQVVERVVTVEHLAPNLAALTMLLERRWPERWNRREQLEIKVDAAGLDSVPPSPLPALVAKLDSLRERMAPPAITVAEVVPGG